MALTLYTYPGNFRAFKILIAAEYNGVAIDVPAFEMMKDNKTPEFLAMSPLGKVPVLKTPQGALFESNAIARYVARMRRDTDLYGATFFASAQVDAWIDFCTHELELAATMWLYPVIGYMPHNPLATAKAKEDVVVGLKTLEAALTQATYLVGDQVTLADIVVASALVYPMKLLMDAKFRAPFPNVMRWFNTMVHQPQFLAVVGQVVLCTAETPAPSAGGAAAAPAPKAAAAPAPKAAAAPAEEGKKEKGGKKAPKPTPEELAKLQADAAERKKRAAQGEEAGRAQEAQCGAQGRGRERRAQAGEEGQAPVRGARRGRAVRVRRRHVEAVHLQLRRQLRRGDENLLGNVRPERLVHPRVPLQVQRRKRRVVHGEQRDQRLHPAQRRNPQVAVRHHVGDRRRRRDPARNQRLLLDPLLLDQRAQGVQLRREHYNWFKVDTATAEGKAMVTEMWCSVDGQHEFLEGKKTVTCAEFK